LVCIGPQAAILSEQRFPFFLAPDEKLVVFNGDGGDLTLAIGRAVVDPVTAT